MYNAHVNNIKKDVCVKFADKYYCCPRNLEDNQVTV